MTSKTTKTVLLAVMLSAIVIPLTIMGNAEAIEATGQTIIKTDTTSSDIPLFDDREALLKTYDSLENGSEKAAVKSQMDEMTSEIQDWYDNTFDQVKYDSFVEAKLAMQQNELEELPWVSRSYDYTNNALEVRIDAKYFTEENIPKYISSIRSIVGNNIALTVGPGEYLELEGCTSRSSSECNPIKGGVQFEADSTNSGTVGFKATYNSKTGFVTAGHNFIDFTDGSQLAGTTIEQHISSTTDIGNLENNNIFFEVNTWCDCAFVSELHSSRSMDDGVYGLSDPNSTQNPYWNLLVTISGGYTGTSSGYVSSTNIDFSADLDDSGSTETNIYDAIRAGYSSQSGDSGSPIISYSGKLVGIHVAASGTFMEHSAVTNSFPGLTWGF